MCEVVSVTWRELPTPLVQQCRLQPYDRGNGEPEYHFPFRVRVPRLPVWVDGRLLVLSWAGYCEKEAIEAGRWLDRKPQPVEVPATLCCDRGVWYPASEGLRGVLVGRQVYLMTEASSHYYKIMTRQNRMPVMVGRGI